MSSDVTSGNTAWRIKLRTLKPTGPVPFDHSLEAAERSSLAEALDVLGVKKARFSGVLRPENKADWRLEAKLGATVVQACIATLEPVTTRIDADVARQYVAEMPEIPDGSEIEMPELDEVEPVPTELDLYDVMVELLSLNLPQYPRAPEADAVDQTFTEPGKTPMSAEDAKPFASLASLRDKLE